MTTPIIPERGDPTGQRAAKRARWLQLFDENPALSNDEVTARVEAEFRGRAPAAPQSLFGEAVDAFTLGLGDNVRAAGGALADRLLGRSTDIRKAYDVRLAEETSRKRSFLDENPVSGTVAQFAGGMLSGGAGVARTVAAQAATTGAPASVAVRAIRALRTPATAASVGGITAAASADQAALEGGSRVPAGLLGAGAAGVAGAALPPTLRAAGALGTATADRVRRIAQLVAPARTAVAEAGEAAGAAAVPVVADAAAVAAPRVPNRRALDLVNRRLQADGVTTAQLRELAATAGPEERLVDMAGPATRRLLAGTEAIPSEGGSLVRTAMDERQRSQGGRVVQALLRGFNRDQAPNPLRAARELAEERAQNAAPLYERAFIDEATGAERMVDTAPLRDFFERFPEFRKALKNAQRLARTDRRPFGMDPVQFLDDNTPFPAQLSMRDMHYIKMGIDDAVADLLPGDKMTTQFGMRLNGARAQLRQALGAVNDDYAVANQTYASDSALMEALQLGRTAARKTPAQIEEDLAAMTPGEAEQYRLAALDDMLRVVKRTGDTRDAAAKVGADGGVEEMRERLALLLPDDESRTAFQRFLEGEGRMTLTKRATQGSRTTPLREDVNEISGVGLVDLMAASQNPTVPGLLMRAGRPVLEAVDRRIAARRADQLAPLLLSRPGEVGAVADALDARSLARAVSAVRRQRAGRRVGAGVGTATGSRE